VIVIMINFYYIITRQKAAITQEREA